MDKLHKSLQGWAKSRIIIFIVKRQGSGHCGWPIRYSEKQKKDAIFRHALIPVLPQQNEGNMKHIEIYTDGACSGNPGPGGWGAILRFRTGEKVYEKEISGGKAGTTNNRMELTGLLEALRQLKEPCDIDLYSDSQYVINGLEKGWAKGWRKRGWKKADKSPALNPDLWAPLLEESEKHVIHYHWLKGHAGHPENERCDRLAVEQSKKYGGKQA